MFFSNRTQKSRILGEVHTSVLAVMGEEDMSEKKDGGETDVVTEEEVKVVDKPKEKSVSKKRTRSRASLRRKNNSGEKEPVEKEKEQKPPTERDTKEPKTAAKKKENEPKTPVTSTIERPVRERKSVERLVTTIEKDSTKDVIIEKGRGTALKDIPNVAYKLSRKKNEDILKLLHTVLFGRRGKAGQLKNNISRFSGFVWHNNEEKQMTRLKEKLDKFVKEKLVEFCEVLDVPISKVNLKEDIIVKLIEFLVEPHATTADLLAEKDQGKKRKRVVKSDSTPSKGSAKSQKKTAGTMSTRGESEDESEEGEAEEEEDEKKDNLNGVPENNDDEMSEQAKSDEEGSISEKESDEQKVGQKSRSSMPSAKKVSTGIAKKVTVSKTNNTSPNNAPAKSSNRSESDKNNGAVISSDKKKQEPSTKKSSDKMKEEPTTKKSLDKKKKGKSTKMSSDKKKEESTAMKSSNKKEEPTTKSSDNDEEESTAKNSLDKKEEEEAAKKSYDKNEEPTTMKSAGKKKEPTTKKSVDKRKEESISKKEEPVMKSSTPKKTSVPDNFLSKEGTGKSILNVKDKAEKEEPEPSNDDIRKSLCKILMEVDFNTATFTDIMKLLAQQFDVDLTHRKADIRGMIQQELTKLAETDDKEDDAGKDEKNPSTVGVNA